MATAAPIQTMQDLLENLGHISPDRVWLTPAPGTATEADVIRIEQENNRLCELVDGVLVEKAMGYREALLASWICILLDRVVRPDNAGLLTGADGMVRLFPGMVRIPDVAFTSWERIPEGQVPMEPIPDLVPELAVEVVSRSNTEDEMARKRNEYFSAGVQIVWLVDPEPRTVVVCTPPDHARVLNETDTLTAEPVLPKFSVVVSEVFAELDRHGATST